VGAIETAVVHRCLYCRLDVRDKLKQKKKNTGADNLPFRVKQNNVLESRGTGDATENNERTPIFDRRNGPERRRVGEKQFQDERAIIDDFARSARFLKP